METEADLIEFFWEMFRVKAEVDDWGDDQGGRCVSWNCYMGDTRGHIDRERIAHMYKSLKSLEPYIHECGYELFMFNDDEWFNAALIPLKTAAKFYKAA